MPRAGGIGTLRAGYPRVSLGLTRVLLRYHMGLVVNLRTARKQAKRRRSEQEAAQNRLAHGRPKAETKLHRANSDKAKRDLEQHRIERKDRP